MKQLLAIVLMLVATASFAQVGDGGRKASKKDQKMMKQSTGMENASKADGGRRAAKDLHKMEKKEDKINKKAEKMK